MNETTSGPDPYSLRRALLKELALAGCQADAGERGGWRSEDFVARGEKPGLEGVVAKRVGST